MLAVCIAVIIMTIAVPSLSGVFAEQQLHQSYDRFIDLAQMAQTKASSEHQPYILKWSDNQVALEPASAEAQTDAGSIGNSNATPTPAPTDSPAAGTTISFGSGESFEVNFPAALAQVQDKEWTFWPTGTCEPASVTYKGPHGTWQADFDPLTCVPTLKKDLPQ